MTTEFRRGTQGMMQVDYEQRIDMDRMREYRSARIKKLSLIHI